MSSQTKTFGAVAACVGCGLLALSIGMVYAVHAKMRMLAEKEQTRAERIAIERESDSLSALIEETAQDRTMLAEAVLTEDTVVAFLAELEEAAREQGLSVQTRSLAVAPLEGSTTFEYLTLEVEVQGSYTEVRNILELYETLPYQLRVEQVVIEKRDADSVSPLWQGTYTLYVTKRRQS